VYIILLQYLFEVTLCKITYNVKMFCGKCTSSPHYQMKINVNAVFCHLILVSQKAFHQQLQLSANFMVLEEILWCMHCSTVLKMFRKQSVMEVTPTSKYLIYTLYCFPVPCAACCAEHQHYFTGEVTAALGTLLRICAFKLHLYTFSPWAWP